MYKSSKKTISHLKWICELINNVREKGLADENQFHYLKYINKLKLYRNCNNTSHCRSGRKKTVASFKVEFHYLKYYLHQIWSNIKIQAKLPKTRHESLGNIVINKPIK